MDMTDLSWTNIFREAALPTAAASTSKTPQYFKGTESNADTRERTDQNFNL